jgi:hypothetical protein
MKKMPQFFGLVFSFNFLVFQIPAKATELAKWVDLFNGKDLSGWVDVNKGRPFNMQGQANWSDAKRKTI